MKDLFKEGWQGLNAHRVRSFLSALGILFGVAAVIGILSIGEGARREQERLIAQLGILNFQIHAADLGNDQQKREEIRRLSRGLSLRDVEALRAELPDARAVGGLLEHDVITMVPRPRESDAVRVVGAEPDYLSGTSLVRRAGRPLTEADERGRHQVALIGTAAALELFGGEDPLGQRVRIDDVWVTIVGVVSDGSGGIGSQVEGVSLDDRNRDLILPLSTLLYRFPHEDNEPQLSEIQVALTDTSQVSGHTQLAARVVRRLHREQEDYELVVPLKLLEQSRAQQRIFNLVMGLIAGISLLVGGIGIMNIMLASVLERTREIGIRLAVGATPQDIQLLFLAEASLISLFGGVVGIAAGFVISAAVSIFTGWETAVSPQMVVLACAIATLEGVIFGYLPARRASELPPAIAVRQV
jgi:putative ABC transport system permease protein